VVLALKHDVHKKINLTTHCATIYIYFVWTRLLTHVSLHISLYYEDLETEIYPPQIITKNISN